jgi:hypothetical protein
MNYTVHQDHKDIMPEMNNTNALNLRFVFFVLLMDHSC